MSLKVFIYGEDGFTNSTLAASLSMLGFEVIGETENQKIADKMISFLVPDVALFQVDFERTAPLSTAKTLRKRFPNMGMVIVTKSEDLRLIGVKFKEIPIGVSVIKISKHGDLDALKASLESAPQHAKAKSEYSKCKFLTDSQVETIRLMAQGNANSEIAKRRYVSEKSVEQMLARIAIEFGIVFDRQQNSRVKILNTYYKLVSGRK